jgi:hypothetical protein
MKKLTKSWSKRYGSLKIFRDDIEEIAGIITSGLEQKESPEGRHNKLAIKADGFVLDNLSELEKFKGNYLSNLSFIVGSYCLDLDLTPKWASLTVDNSDDTTLMGIAMRIDDVLKKRHRFLGYLNTKTGYSLLGILIGISVQLFFYAFYTAVKSTAFAIVFAIASGIVGLITLLDLLFMWHLGNHVSIIYLRYSREESNFFVRNRDAILVSAITAVFSVIGTLFVQAVLTKSKDKAPTSTSPTVPKEVNEVSQKQPEK